MQDMRSTSTFLHTLNGSSGSTFPDAYYTLWSTEDWNMQYRLIDAMDDGVEDGSVMRIAALVTGVYLVSHDLAYGLAGLYYDDWVRTGDLYFYNAHVYWSFVAAAFLDGVHAIGWRWQYDWNVNVVGTSPTSLDSDGLVRTSSQRPSFVREERWIPIPGGVNHFEQRTKQPALDALGRALEMDDIGVSTRIAPLEVSISGPSILSAGEVGTWTAKPSGGESPYAYDWEYQWICSSEADSGGGISLADLPCDTWEDGGGNATFSSSASSGMDGLRLRLTVVDTKEREKTAEHLVEIDSI